MRSRRRSLLTLAALLLTQGAAAAPAPPAWVAESNRNAAVLLDVMAEFNPEDAGQLGVEGHDKAVMDLGPDLFARHQEAVQAALTELDRRRGSTTNAAVLQDLSILEQAAKEGLESERLQHALLLPYYNVPQVVYAGIKALLDPRIPAARQQYAVARLRAYAGMDARARPIAELARMQSTDAFDRDGMVGPYRGEIEQDLADAPRYIIGIRQLFEQSALKGYEQPLAALQKQLRDYSAWVRSTMLPHARTDHRLPSAIYADNLKQFGVDVAPDELIRRALLSFAEIRSEMQALAPLVAAQQHLKSNDYRDVIRALKQQQITGDAILPFYRQRLATVEGLIRDHHIVTLPARDAVIRMATPAETAMIPSPHMSPPRLVGNTDEYGEFVLPLNVPGKEGRKELKTDDFTFDAAAWTLIAHEARPGHELQFASMIEKGVSTARAVFAFNSVNVEGWALYAEAEMKPLFPLEGQLIGLQFRLMRAARAFLDPMLNLGQFSPEQVREFLEREVVLSPGFAQEEVDRYAFRAPGQATSYFVGYQALMTIRERAQLALGEHFDLQRFNDFALAQGLVPPSLLEKAVMTEFVPGERAPAAKSGIEIRPAS